MPHRVYKGDPLTPKQREEHEDDLIDFCDRELDLLGDVEGLDVLYAGGSSPLWIEGLSERIGPGGSLTTLDSDAERVEGSRELLAEDAALAAPVRLVVGDVFRPPFAPNSFGLVYSAGLFHELDVSARPAKEALRAVAAAVRPGGRIATSDFVDSAPAAQLDDEDLERELAREASGAELYGVGPPERLVGLHEALLKRVRWRLSPPRPIRHLDKMFLAEGEPEELRGVPAEARRRLRARREALRGRVRKEGYTRLATLYIEGFVLEPGEHPGGRSRAAGAGLDKRTRPR